MDYNKLLFFITIIFSFVTLFTSIKELLNKKYSFLCENLVTYILFLFFLLAQYKLVFHVKLFIISLVLITFIGHNFIGQYLDLYHRSKHYDAFLHALGSFSFSLFTYSIIDRLTSHIIYSKLYVSIFVIAIGISLGCVFELGEFALDFFTGSKHQHGLLDTNSDLLANLIGSIIAGIISSYIFF
ncbi:MAG: hypothetical protein AB9856_02240 [Cellulosilyticaceae bacterium]